MTKEEINNFILIMKEICEDWTPERVEEEYGDCATLREALDKRLSKMNTFWNFVEEVVKPDLIQLGRMTPDGKIIPPANSTDTQKK